MSHYVTIAPSPLQILQRLLAVLSYIQENYTTVTLSDLSETFNYNPTYLSRALSKYTGRSFSEIVQHIRFEQSLKLLATTDESIEDIINDIGYSDRTYFYREFKKRYDMSPAEYRSHQLLLLAH